MTNHLASRQNVLKAPNADLEARLETVAQAFGMSWLLEEGAHPIQKLWHRKDALATNQLAWLGDAIIKMRTIDARWTDAELKKVKTDATELGNNRKGAIFEIIGLAIFTEGVRVVPRPGGNPGYDGTFHFPDGGKMDISLKNYGLSTHERGVRTDGLKLEEKFLEVLDSLALNGLHLRVIAKVFPSDSDWSRLRENLNGVVETAPQIEGHVAQDSVWTIILRPLAAFDPRTAPRLSYQVTVMVPLHQNERQNLISKLDEAYANAQKHGKSEDGLARAVMFHLPENASMANCEDWAKQYFADRPDGLVDLVIFYQPAVVNGSQTSIIGHSFVHVPGPRFAKWFRPANGKRRQFSGSVYVGEILQEPAKLELRNDDGATLSLENHYVFESGHLFVGFESAGGRLDMVVRQPAPGLLNHAVALMPDGSQLEVRGIFPPTMDLIVFS